MNRSDPLLHRCVFSWWGGDYYYYYFVMFCGFLFLRFFLTVLLPMMSCFFVVVISICWSDWFNDHKFFFFFFVTCVFFDLLLVAYKLQLLNNLLQKLLNNMNLSQQLLRCPYFSLLCSWSGFSCLIRFRKQWTLYTWTAPERSDVKPLSNKCWVFGFLYAGFRMQSNAMQCNARVVDACDWFVVLEFKFVLR